MKEITLAHEAEVLHRLFFLTEPPSGFSEAYVQAHVASRGFAEAEECELRTVSIVVERSLDALGIEPWLRGRPRSHLLSRKLLLIAYLAECDAAHLEFRREERGRLRAFARLGRAGFSAAVRLARGRLQIAMYGLV